MIQPSPSPETLLKALFEAAIERAAPAHTVAAHLPPPPTGRTVVVGAGKAAAAMAAAVEESWFAAGEKRLSGLSAGQKRDGTKEEGQLNLQGLVVTRYGHGYPTRFIEVVEAAHPVPDDAGEAVARRILDMVSGLTADDLVLCLISGGGSALLALPVEGLTLAHKRAVNQALLKSGAAIDEMNIVRKHLSAIKGGRLAASAHPARVVTLAISDVPGDDPAVIASGPTVADPSTFEDARRVLKKYAITPPAAVARHLKAASDETPKPGDTRLAAAEVRLIATPGDALAASAEVARAAGFEPRVLGDAIEGEARALGREHARMAMKLAAAGERAVALISGGETTVNVQGKGRGGRNAEYLLGLALELNGHADIVAIAGDTDGIDGSEDNAGALVRPDTLARGRERGLDANAYIADNDAYSYFQALGDLVITGPTLTNVNDFRCILIP